MKPKKTRLTVDLPRDLIQHADKVVNKGAAPSRNQLIAQAVETYLHVLEEAEIDAQFEAMAEDESYKRLALQVTQEFEAADREALKLGEGHEY